MMQVSGRVDVMRVSSHSWYDDSHTPIVMREMGTPGAGRFKATCLRVLDEVQAKQEPVLLIKHGKSVAKLVPLDIAEEEIPLARFRFPGKMTLHGDLTEPLHPEAELEEFFETTVKQINGQL